MQLVHAQFQVAQESRFTTFQPVNVSVHQFKPAHATKSGMPIYANALPTQLLLALILSITFSITPQESVSANAGISKRQHAHVSVHPSTMQLVHALHNQLNAA